MNGRLTVHTAHVEDGEWLRRLARTVFDRYTGGLHRWALDDDDGIRRIHLGERAGVLAVRLAGRTGCVKLFYDNRPRVICLNRLGFPKARLAFENGLELARRDIPAPAMLGWAVDGRTGLALLVTELIADAERVDLWIAAQGLTEDLIGRLAGFVRRMHDAGVGHDDLSLRNLLVGRRGGGLSLWILDYEDAVFRKAMSRRRRLWDLHHLYERALALSGVEDRLLFLRHYLGDAGDVARWAEDLRASLRRHPSKYSRACSPEGEK